METISTTDLNTKIQSGEVLPLIDVRSPAEYQNVHATGAENIPLDTLTDEKVTSIKEKYAGKKVYFICQSGGRSGRACELLEKHGFDHAINVKGGTAEWSEKGYPVVRAEAAPAKSKTITDFLSTIPIEQQVRIFTGAAIIFCLLFGAMWKFFYFLIMLIGVGLIYSGISGVCMMGTLLRKMHWNNRN
jgi:rhodanese-related sulfurtransferase